MWLKSSEQRISRGNIIQGYIHGPEGLIPVKTLCIEQTILCQRSWCLLRTPFIEFQTNLTKTIKLPKISGYTFVFRIYELQEPHFKKCREKCISNHQYTLYLGVPYTCRQKTAKSMFPITSAVCNLAQLRERNRLNWLN